MTLHVGDKAPNFKLISTEKEPVELSDYDGKNVLLLFFPLAFTGVCTTELCSVRDNLSQYNDAKVEVFGISVDSLFSLDKFKEEQNLNFTLLSDFNKEASTAYGCLYKDFVLDMKGVSKRSAFLIDKNGLLQYTEILDDAGQLPDFNAIEQAIKELN